MDVVPCRVIEKIKNPRKLALGKTCAAETLKKRQTGS
jgi:hypothetical protein